MKRLSSAVLASLLLVLTCASPPQDLTDVDMPSGWLALKKRLRTFSTLRAIVSTGVEGAPASSPNWIFVTDEPFLAVTAGDGPFHGVQFGWRWQEGEFRRFLCRSASEDWVEQLPSRYAEDVAPLWEELRSGFAHSRVERAGPASVVISLAGEGVPEADVYLTFAANSPTAGPIVGSGMIVYGDKVLRFSKLAMDWDQPLPEAIYGDPKCSWRNQRSEIDWNPGPLFRLFLSDM